jgi:hypothetical protein
MDGVNAAGSKGQAPNIRTHCNDWSAAHMKAGAKQQAGDTCQAGVLRLVWQDDDKRTAAAWLSTYCTNHGIRQQ